MKSLISIGLDTRSWRTRHPVTAADSEQDSERPTSTFMH